MILPLLQTFASFFLDLTSSNLAGLFLTLHLQSDLFLLLQIDSINSQQLNNTAAIEIAINNNAREERKLATVAYCSPSVFLAISEQIIHAHGSIGSKNIRNTQENTPDASGFVIFSVFLNPQRSVGS
jgi:hypothetical protein